MSTPFSEATIDLAVVVLGIDSLHGGVGFGAHNLGRRVLEDLKGKRHPLIPLPLGVGVVVARAV